MPELRDLLEQAGHRDVRTLLQSGNVVLSSDRSPSDLTGELERQISAGVGFDVQVVVRSRAQLAKVVARDPLADVVTNPKRYQVSFLSGKPDPKAIKQATAAVVAPERFVHLGREIYAWHPEGVQRSKLAQMLADKRLGVSATARNWNTVTKLLELASE